MEVTLSLLNLPYANSTCALISVVVTSLDASPVSACSNGNVYSTQLLDEVALNLHRIDKDVQRCDRNHPYFTLANLEKLRNIMCT